MRAKTGRVLSFFVFASVFAVFTVFALSAPAFAATGINQELNYQGTLKDAAGNTVADGSYDMVFKLYTASSGGSPIWTGTYTAANGNAVTVTKGLFTVLLGSGTGNSLSGVNFNQDTLYLGITVGTDAEMTPRLRVGSAAYAFNAGAVNGLSFDPAGSYSAGNVVFADAASALSATSSIYIDPSTGNIGIGTSTTPTALSVAGDITVSSTTDPSEGEIVFGNLGGAILYNSSDFNIFNASLYTDAGRIVAQGADDTQALGTRFNKYDGTYFLGASDSASPDLLFINNGGQERARLTDAGHLGIGTTSPSQALSVAGNGLFSGNVSLANLAATGGVGIGASNATAGTLVINADNLLGPTQGDLTIEHPTSGGASSIVFPSTVNRGSDYGSITYYDDNNSYNFWGDSTENSALVIGAQNDGLGSDSDVVALQGAAADILGTSDHAATLIVDDNGRVGIGTTSPSQALSIAGSAYATGGLGVGAVNTTAGTILATATSTAFNFLASSNGAQGAPAFTFSSAPTSGMYMVGSNNLRFSANGVNGLTVTDSQVYTPLSGNASGPAIALSSANLGFFSPSSNVLGFSTGGSERMRLDGSGNLAIGTTSPDSKLSVWGGSGNIADFVTSASSSALFISSGGQVGIGTTAPSSALTVLGGATSSETVFSSATTGASYTVPAGVTQLTVKTWGAGGGGAGSGFSGTGGTGGGGGFAQATIAVTPGETLTVKVGGAGGAGVYSSVAAAGGTNGGGAGGPGLDASNGYGSGGGGGYSGVLRSSTMLVQAGGGGGGGSIDGSDPPGAGGAGGGTNGVAGGNVYSSSAGGGGTQSAGGAGGTNYSGCALNATSGSQNQGGTGAGASGAYCAANGPGGGGGHYGGGGGGMDNDASAGGGGGSDYVSGTNTVETAGSGRSAANTTDPDYAGGAGVGGTGSSGNSGSAGAAGRVVIIPISPSALLVENSSASPIASFLVSGDVGIGTTNPDGYFSDADALVVASGNSTGGLSVISATSTGKSVISFGYTTGTTVGSNSNYGKIWENFASNTLNFESGPGNYLPQLTLLGSNNFVGIGTSTPYASLTVWGQSPSSGNALELDNSASTTLMTVSNAGVLSVGGSGVFTVDGVNSTTTIANLSTGNLTFDTDAGVVMLSDIPIDSNAASGVPESQSIGLGGNQVLTVWGQANGSGSITNTRVGINVASPSYVLDVASTTSAGPVVNFTNSTGSCSINPTSSSLSCSSDERLKTNILSLDASSTLAGIMGLSPVTYNWLTEATGTPSHTGFIAQAVQQVFPDLVSPGPGGYLTLNYVGFVPYIISAVQTIEQDVLAFAQEFTTQKLCLADSNGTTCITRGQLNSLLAGSGATNDAATSTVDSTPSITLNGNNPATIQVGATYSDLGATVSDSAYPDIGYDVSLDNGATTTLDQLSLDTSVPGTHAIVFSFTDPDGNSASATRTVNVVEGADASSTPSSDDATTTDATSTSL